jgi:hypothetical protein
MNAPPSPHESPPRATHSANACYSARRTVRPVQPRLRDRLCALQPARRGPAAKSDRPKVRDRIGSELHQVTDLVRSFTGGFTAPSMKATPGAADAKGTTAGATTTNGPSAEEYRSKAASADAA